MHLGRIKEEIEIMKEILKNKAINLYLNKVSKEKFEIDLYNLLDNNDLKKNTFFYDLVILNYNDINYKNILFNLLKKHSSEEEMLCLKIYQKCISIINSKEQKEILSIIDELSSLCYKTEYYYDVFYSFDQLSEGISLKKGGFYCIPFKTIVNEAKLLSKELVNKFDEFKIEEDWNDFLHSLPNDIHDMVEKKPVEKSVSKKVGLTKKWYEFWK